MAYVFKVTKAGSNVNTETEPKNFIFNSEYGSVIIYKEDEESLTISASSEAKSTVNFDQTFSYVPIVKIHAELTPSSGRWYNEPFIFNSSYYNSESSYIISDDSTKTGVETSKFYLTFKNTTASQITIKYRYYILANLG